MARAIYEFGNVGRRLLMIVIANFQCPQATAVIGH